MTLSQAYSESFPIRGLQVLRKGNIAIYICYPSFRFRPSQADALHVDLWLDSNNLLRDAGSYSYNTELKWLNYFNGTASHNTVQFDDRDQMPRISRFLFGNWLKTSRLETLIEDTEAVRFGAGYQDSWGAMHFRRIKLRSDLLIVEDEIAGFAKKAVLRWRLSPGEWRLESSGNNNFLVTSDMVTIAVQTTMTILRCAVVDGWEYRHYLEKTTVPVLELEVYQPGTLTTKVTWPI